MKKQYEIEFVAKGISKIKTELEEVLKIYSNLNLNKKKTLSASGLNRNLTSIENRLNEELKKEQPSTITLDQLKKEYLAAINEVKKFYKELLKSFETTEADRVLDLDNQVQEKIKELRSARGRKGSAGKWLTESTRDNINVAAPELQDWAKFSILKKNIRDNSSFAKLSSTKSSIEIGDNIISSWEQFVNVLTSIKNVAGEDSEQFKELNNILNTTQEQISQVAEEKKSDYQQASTQYQTAYNDYVKILETQKQDKSLDVDNSIFKNIQNNQATLNELVTEAEESKNSIDQVRIAHEKNSPIITNNTKLIHENTDSISKNTSTLGKAAKQVFTYGSLLSGMRRIYQTTISTIKEMDEALTGMAVVTTMSREEAWALVNEFQNLAYQTGKTTAEIANMATKFYQQGKSTTQVLQLTKAAAMAASIAGIDGSRSIDLLTNAMNGFQMSASDAMEVSDKFAALAAAAATDYEELAVALSKVASQANLAGTSMDFTLGLLTAGIEITREAPETIGTALKTIIARMRELTDYGKTLEDGVDVNRVAAALSNIGIELMDEEGQFRDLEAVITEIGKKWDTLNKNQQANVAVAMAGTRQQSRFIAMMQDFERTQELVNISANSYGATLAQQSKYMDGLQAAINNLTTAYQGLITNITNSEVFINAINFFTDLVKALDWSKDKLTLLIPILTLIGTTILQSISNKITELTLSKQQIQLDREKRAEEREARIKELKDHKDRVKELSKEKALEALNAAQRVSAAKKEVLNNAKIETSEKRINLAIAEQNLLKNKGSKQALADVEAARKDLNNSIIQQNQAQEEYNEALENENKIRQETNFSLSEQYELNKLNNEQLASTLANFGMLGSIASSIFFPLKNTYDLIKSLIVSFTSLISLKKASAKATDLETKAETKKALAAAAANAALNIPVAGIAIAGTILSIIGVASSIGTIIAGFSATKKTKTIEDTLNKMQVELYNLQQSANNVSKLADEFDDLSDKINKSNDDLQRMEEIIQQINDEAGKTVVSMDDTIEQRKRDIAAYQDYTKLLAQQKNNEIEQVISEDFIARGFADGTFKYNKDNPLNSINMFIRNNQVGNLNKVQTRRELIEIQESLNKLNLNEDIKKDIDNSINNFLNGIGEIEQVYNSLDLLFKDKIKYYTSEFTSKTSNREAIRTIAQERISLFDEAESELQDLILNMAVNEFDDILKYTGEIDFTYFNSIINEDFVKTMNKLINSNSLEKLSDYYFDLLESSDKIAQQQAEYLKNNSNIYAAIDALGKNTIKVYNKIGIQVEDLNEIYKLLGDDIKNYSDAINSAGTDFEARKNLLEEGSKAILKKREKVNKEIRENTLTNEQLILKAEKDNYEGLTEYQILLADKLHKEKLKNIAEEALVQAQTNAINSGFEVDSEEYNNAIQNALDNYLSAAGLFDEAEGKLEEYLNSGLITNIIKLQNLLFDNSYDKIIDQITRFTSSLERLTKELDLNNLSLIEQAEILEDYPDLFNQFMSGKIDGSAIYDFYQQEYDSLQQEVAENLKADVAKQDNTYSELGTINGIDFSNFLNTNSMDTVLKIINLSEEEKENFMNQIMSKLSISDEEAETLLNDIIGTSDDFLKNSFLAQKLEQGISALINPDLLRTVKNISSQYYKLNFEIDKNTNELERLLIGTDDYNNKLKERNKLLINSNLLVSEQIKEIREEMSEWIGNTSLDGYVIPDILQNINGELIINADIYDKLSSSSQHKISIVVDKLQELAEEEQKIWDQFLKNNELLIQTYIDQETEATNKYIEELEKRREAYEKYFDELDAIKEEEEYTQDREDILKQLAALSGGADSATKQRIKELKGELESLNEEQLESQTQRQRDAILNKLDDEIEIQNNHLEELNNSLNRLLSILDRTATNIQEDEKNIIIKIFDQLGFSEAERKKLVGFKNGGLVDMTGPVMVHGTTSNPEAFLDATDTRNIQKLMDLLKSNFNLRLNPISSAYDKTNSFVIENITIETKELNNKQDWAESGKILAEEFAQAVQKRGININVKK